MYQSIYIYIYIYIYRERERERVEYRVVLRLRKTFANEVLGTFSIIYITAIHTGFMYMMNEKKTSLETLNEAPPIECPQFL